MTDMLSILTLAIGLAIGLRLAGVRGTRVVVTTVRGQSIRGRRCLALRRIVLADAELLGKPARKLEGRIEIPRRNIAMMQVLSDENRAAVPQKSSRFAQSRPGESA